MKDINGYKVPNNVIDAIKWIIEGKNNNNEVVITSINSDKENYHVEFISQLFSSISIPKYEIEKIIRDSKINKLLNE